jgi:hypothetical protein
VARRGEIAVRVTSLQGTRTDFFYSHVEKEGRKDRKSEGGKDSEVCGECRERQRIKSNEKGEGKREKVNGLILGVVGATSVE